MDQEELDLFGVSVASADLVNEPIAPGELFTPAGLLALMALPGVGSGRALKLAHAFHNVDTFNAASAGSRRSACGAAPDGHITVTPAEAPEGSRVVGYFDDEYPALLRSLKSPPAVLWVRGQLPTIPCVAVVGGRDSTRWGKAMADSVARHAVGQQVGVVSGLAFGIDIAAHRATVDEGGYTLAVLGSGIDNVSPAEHSGAAEKIVGAGGCLITEQPPGTQASARTLMPRNRMQAGLSFATIVVQCAANSGTLRTAEDTIKQGKILAITPPQGPEADLPQNAGSLALLKKQNALALRTPADLMAFLGTRSPSGPEQPEG